jgi:Ca-activated chloride channel family protein
MKKNLSQLSVLNLVRLMFPVLLLIITAVSRGQQTDEVTDRTYSPRFYIPNSDTTLDALPLKASSADVSIAGVIADVTIDQVYTNEGTRAIEAKYVFPASTRAAVYYLHMKIGSRLMIADVVEKQEAQQMYDSALANGNTATLLEQMTPNVFQMSVANILPGDTIEIEMRYTELLVPTESVYEFVYPTVVGPRYTGGNGEEWTEGPYQHEGEDPLYDFNIEVRIHAGMSIAEVNCISDPGVPVIFDSEEEVSVIPDENSNVKGNKDFILQYRLAGNAIKTGLLAWEGEDENFFLAMMQPPQHPEPSDIPPREYIFIMDVSGSMYGYPLSISKAIMIDLLYDLRANDRFNIIFFAGGNYTFRPASVEATEKNISAAIEAVENQTGGGGTELLSALNNALAMSGTEDFSRIFLILTDGYVAVEKEAFDLIRNNLGEANFFAFGIGTSVNRYIIEGMAHVGQGESFIATSQEEGQEKAEWFRTYVDAPVLTNITAEFNDFQAYDVEPLSVPDIFAARPVILYGKYEGALGGSIKINGLSGSSNYSSLLNLSEYQADEDNRSLMYLWARKRIQMLEDYTHLSYLEDEDIINEIIELGIHYNLLTAYTSFIVIDSIIRCDTCSAETVNQPLPLPEGVTDLAMPGGGYYGLEGLFADRMYTGNGVAPRLKEYIAQVYPNPASQYIAVTINLGNEDADLDRSLQIVDLNGKLVHEIDLSELGFGTHTLFFLLNKDLHVVTPGNYFLRLMRGQETVHSVILTIHQN